MSPASVVWSVPDLDDKVPLGVVEQTHGGVDQGVHLPSRMTFIKNNLKMNEVFVMSLISTWVIFFQLENLRATNAATNL